MNTVDEVIREAQMAARGQGQSLTEEEKRAISRLLVTLDEFRHIRQTISVQQVVAFLVGALDEYKGVTEYARTCDVSQSVMSRHLLDIGSQYRGGESGLGLVAKRESMESLSKREVFLTPLGRTTARKLARIILGKGD